MPKGIYAPSLHKHGPNPSLADRFWSKVDRDGPVPPGLDSPCWLWTRGLFRRGLPYGQFSYDGRPHGAHRIAWFLATGNWPTLLAHRCDQPRCVNPSHLWEATSLENNRDMTAKGRHPKTGKLTDAQVAEIRERAPAAGWGGIRRLAREYGVSETMISKIVHGLVRTVTPDGPVVIEPLPKWYGRAAAPREEDRSTHS